MAACENWLIHEPETLRGVWRARFKKDESAVLELEIGCGKGAFITEMARQNPEKCFIAIERVPSVLLTALEKAKAEQIPNLLMLGFDAIHLEDIFAEQEIDRMYINFCDPWLPKKQNKRRLTFSTYLKLYESFLKPEGEICFKTDNRRLFEDSLCYFSQSGWGLYDVTFDLHHTDTPNIVTEYERNFSNQGYPIYRCVAKKNNQGKDADSQKI